jgi:hypothetical protein
VSQVASPALHPKKLFEKCILRQPAGHASHRWPTSNLYFYSNMRPAVSPLLHLEIISAAMGVAGCIPRNERELDLPKVYFSRSKRAQVFQNVEIAIHDMISKST